ARDRQALERRQVEFGLDAGDVAHTLHVVGVFDGAGGPGHDDQLPGGVGGERVVVRADVVIEVLVIAGKARDVEAQAVLEPTAPHTGLVHRDLFRVVDRIGDRAGIEAAGAVAGAPFGVERHGRGDIEGDVDHRIDAAPALAAYDRALDVGQLAAG